MPPLVQVMPEPDVELPHAPSGRPPFRKIEGSLFLPEPVAIDVQRQADEMDSNTSATFCPLTARTGTLSVSWGGGGVPSPFIFREEDDQSDDGDNGEPEVSTGDQLGDPINPITTTESGEDPESREEESDDVETPPALLTVPICRNMKTPKRSFLRSLWQTPVFGTSRKGR